MKTIIYKSAPSELISKIEQYPRIQNIISVDWGTLRLKKFLENLINDTRNGSREGFPVEVLFAIVGLSLANDNYLKDFGLVLDENPVSEFAQVKWDLPKDF